ncbi:hypothetical protein [Streptomyces inhibens]|uniref:hypothetical protein n=1 Tax=Streptomyces inhibens TaxID=2293571 RepID=UPI001EE6F0AC|nr:hypothetical protein [Streptomyces inhibens]UKY50441.1 hypothetical protein KI385_17505 [Streptomyces inhibens]
MRSPQLAFCAAVAACAVTTAPAYGGDARGAGTGTGTVSVTPAVAAASGSAGTGAVPSAGPNAVPRAVPSAVPPHGRPGPATEAGPRRELSSTSAVGLVLAGGTVLVIAGQLLRLRLRLRRERQGDVDES